MSGTRGVRFSGQAANDCFRPIADFHRMHFEAALAAANLANMEFFSRAWALGDLSDEAFERIEERYRGYIESLDPDGPVRRFATTISLNDAYVDRLNYSDGVLSLRLLTGDMQRGYWHTLIRYGGGSIVYGLAALEQAVTVRPTEIWYDEFASAPARMVHRFLLVKPNTSEDRGEVHIEFEGFSFSETRAAGRILGEV